MRSKTYDEYKTVAMIAGIPRNDWLTEEQWNARNAKLAPQKETTPEKELARYNEEPPEDM